MKLKKILSEVMMQEVPSQNSDVDFSFEAELEDLKNSVVKYEESAIKQFEDDIKMKLDGKQVTHKGTTLNVDDVKVTKSEGQYVVVLEGDGDKIVLSSQSSVSIANDVEGPTTNVMQNKSVNSDSSPHKIKQF